MSDIGPVESLVLQAWSAGVRIDAGDAGYPGAVANRLIALLMRAREIDRTRGRASEEKHDGSH